MKTLVSILVIASIATSCCATQQQPAPAASAVSQAATSQASVGQSTQQQPSASATSGVASVNNEQRKGRSISSTGNSSNNLINSNLNIIEHTSSKSRIEQEKRAVQEFLTPKNILKSLIRMVFGAPEEANATSRQVLSMLSKVLDIVKNTFGQKSRSQNGRTFRESAEDVASAGVSMLQGYVKSVMATDDHCAKRHLCMASREAIRDGRELGFVVATVGGYATSYLLDTSRSSGFNTYYDAVLKGRTQKDDCVKLYPDCAEQ